MGIVGRSGIAGRSPQRVDVTAGAVRLSALDYGNDGAPPLVVLHGHADLAWSMDRLASALAGDHHVVSFDLRGHGDSDQPGAYSVLHMVADLVTATAALGLERPVVVAHSLGGHVAAHHAALYPDQVTALVLLEGLGPPLRWPEPTAANRAERERGVVQLLATPFRHKPLPDVDAAAARLLATHPRLDPAWARSLAEQGTRPGPDGGLVWKFDPRTRDWFAGMDSHALEGLWAQVTCPTLVIDGAESWDTWWSVRAMMVSTQLHMRLSDDEWAQRVATFADVTHVVLDGAGHMVHFDQPEALEAAVVAFLADRGPTAG